jgi:hypothetical protein
VDKIEATAEIAEKFRLLKNKVKLLACSQTGSRFLQKEVELRNPSLVEFILSDLGESLSSITTDRYGNYFC